MSTTAEPWPPPRHGTKRFLIALLVLIILNVVAFFAGDAGRAFGRAGLMVLPFALLAGLSYAGEHDRASRAMALAVLLLIVAGMAASFFGQSAELLRHTAPADAEPYLLRIAAVMGLGAALGIVTLTGPGRRAASRLVPIDADRFTHAVALAFTLIATACALAPLIVIGQPTLTALAAHQAVPRELDSGLHVELYPLYWLIPVSVLAVGYGIRRTLAQALARLGLTRPRLGQIALSLLIAALLVLGVSLLGRVVDALWSAMGWPRTDTATFQQLLGHLISPAGALIIGVSAGLGEELVVRGVLQPRLGIWLSNILFTALHASQYHWDYLLLVLFLGLAFGLVRRYGSTTMSAIVHGAYNFFIVLLVMSAPS